MKHSQKKLHRKRRRPRDCLKSQDQQHPEIIKVFGESFSKKLQKTPPFSIERRHPKTFLFPINGLFLNNLQKTVWKQAFDNEMRKSGVTSTV
ncbi:hypothetical protein [Novacetimonas hansenii]|uniref:hypothetical protein n=1 Tax=Novacetimonas hansenii TaxID=436 RepID=UPI00248D45F7|nr:hypothetical protein [Novacetimonas hansenii]